MAGVLTLASSLAACDPADVEESQELQDDEVDLAGPDEAPLSDYRALFEGMPTNDELPLPLSALPRDALPSSSTALLAYQTPVKSQGARGVCSIFSSTALMEHLYLVAGMENPDFSEQYLQWASKFLYNAFPTSSGSNDSVNLQTVSRWGIPAEQDWPYEFSQWDLAQDPECDGEDDQPTRCYTNGHPPVGPVAAPKYQLPSAQAINSSPTSIMNHIDTYQTGVVVGIDFFYQAWNHRLSTLPRNMNYWYQGVVTYPNEQDIVESHEQRAGHAVLIVGWDEDLEFQSRDADGNFIYDENGDPVMERGFYIFKNSWGTQSFGLNNPYGPGYGFLSMDYVQDHANARRITQLPELVTPPSDDFEGHLFPVTTPVDIPDNDANGVEAVIPVLSPGRTGRVRVSLLISHRARGNLQVRLRKGNRSVLLHDRTGGSADHVYLSTVLDDFEGTKRNGDWVLEMADLSSWNTGSLLFWYLEFET